MGISWVQVGKLEDEDRDNVDGGNEDNEEFEEFAEEGKVLSAGREAEREVVVAIAEALRL